MNDRFLPRIKWDDPPVTVDGVPTPCVIGQPVEAVVCPRKHQAWTWAGMIAAGKCDQLAKGTGCGAGCPVRASLEEVRRDAARPEARMSPAERRAPPRELLDRVMAQLTKRLGDGERRADEMIAEMRADPTNTVIRSETWYGDALRALIATGRISVRRAPIHGGPFLISLPKGGAR